eukprot:3376869-Heterocapsa_arctica.AAC.1
MEYDTDGRSLTHLIEQALDTKEWGGFEQQMIFSKMYCINVEIHSFGTDMQKSDGDEFITEKCLSQSTSLQSQNVG